ncbi:alpha/beta hydrolase [Thermomonospora umbrina]|uniref:S-formylglutathione hydrolase FrmB n=1 Tax=Thermomonospora umbrina TaxID=111806 RepID=A0A3D9T133_9ACTN|nr:alpha/beta hydrolase-fold protein [Thermomonospora umbrina]REE98955.1 S-formylglutathione hydrolase FrmB [Thermomonospora umbrina]
MNWSRRAKTFVGVCASAPVLALAPALPSVPAPAATADGATVVQEVQVNARTFDFKVSSPALGSQQKWVRLYVPPGWTPTAGGATWPTLWMLHGGFANHHAWEAEGEGRLREMTQGKNVIVVMPETTYCSSYTNWRNDAQGEPPQWEKYLIEDVDQILRARYHASTDRAIGGISMGGIGSFGLPQRNPGFFKAAASYSGNLDPMHDHPITKAADNLGPNDPPKRDKRGGGCTLSDVPSAPWEDDPQSGLVPIWGRAQDTVDPDGAGPRLSGHDYWKRHNPVSWPQSLAGIPLYMAVGDTGNSLENLVKVQADAMHAALNGAGVPVTYKKTNTLPIPSGWDTCTGGHDYACWNPAIKDSLPTLLGAIGVS